MSFYYPFHNIQTFEKAKSPKLILTFFRGLNCHSDGCKGMGEQFIKAVNYVSYSLNLGLLRLKSGRRRVLDNSANYLTATPKKYVPWRHPLDIPFWNT